MAKFKNKITETGFFRFEDQLIEFSGVLETEEKALINNLKQNSNWECLDKEENSNELEFKSLKEKAKKLEIKFDKKISFEDLTKLVEAFEKENANDNL